MLAKAASALLGKAPDPSMDPDPDPDLVIASPTPSCTARATTATKRLPILQPPLDTSVSPTADDSDAGEDAMRKWQSLYHEACPGVR